MTNIPDQLAFTQCDEEYGCIFKQRLDMVVILISLNPDFQILAAELC